MKIFACLAFLLQLIGCASVVNDRSQPIRIETVSSDGKLFPGADCKLSNDFGSFLGKSGDVVQVHRSSKDLDLRCALSGKDTANGLAVSRANQGMAGNLLIGGGIGAIIDHNLGTAYTYPTWVRLVFGQTRVYDRKYEVDGKIVTGTLPDAISAAATAAGIDTPTSGIAAIGYINSGFAKIDDVDAMPYINDKGRVAYVEWLTKPPPRAFAISSTGTYAFSWGIKPQDKNMPTDPLERAMLVCEQRANQTCQLYAVNNSVVWSKPVPTAQPALPPLAQPTSLPPEVSSSANK